MINWFYWGVMSYFLLTFKHETVLNNNNIEMYGFDLEVKGWGGIVAHTYCLQELYVWVCICAYIWDGPTSLGDCTSLIPVFHKPTNKQFPLPKNNKTKQQN